MSGVILLSGHVRVEVDGVLRAEGPNVVTILGKELVAQILATSATKPSHFGFGTGGSPITPPAETQTALVDEIAVARHAFAVSRVSNVVTYSTQGGHWVNTSGGDVVLGEIGIFNDVSVGTMLSRFLTSTITLRSAAVVNVQWSLTLG